MIKTATNIIKGVLRPRKHIEFRFPQIGWVREKILKHQEDISEKELSFGRFTIHYKRPYELLHSYREIFEKEIYRFHSGKENPLVIDCGSNIGLSVVYFKQIYPGARVISFEPDEGNFHLLRQNVEKNQLMEVTLYQAAVWIRDGAISFESRESEASHIQEGGDGKSVKAMRLKTILQNTGPVDFMKMDIEGAEYEVMEDISNELGVVKNLFLEYHGKVEDTKKLTRLLTIVQEAGFRVYIRNAADNLDYPFVQERTGTIYDVQLNIFCYK